jgi:hypothetical protein
MNGLTDGDDWHGQAGPSSGRAASDPVDLEQGQEDRSRPRTDAVRCTALGKARRDFGLLPNPLSLECVENDEDDDDSNAGGADGIASCFPRGSAAPLLRSSTLVLALSESLGQDDDSLPNWGISLGPTTLFLAQAAEQEGDPCGVHASTTTTSRACPCPSPEFSGQAPPPPPSLRPPAPPPLLPTLGFSSNCPSSHHHDCCCSLSSFPPPSLPPVPLLSVPVFPPSRSSSPSFPALPPLLSRHHSWPRHSFLSSPPTARFTLAELQPQSERFLPGSPSASLSLSVGPRASRADSRSSTLLAASVHSPQDRTSSSQSPKDREAVLTDSKLSDHSETAPEEKLSKPNAQHHVEWMNSSNTSDSVRDQGLGQPQLDSDPPVPHRSPTPSLRSVDENMVRIGIRWQLAALVLISSLIGLAVVTIATWVGRSMNYL